MSHGRGWTPGTWEQAPLGSIRWIVAISTLSSLTGVALLACAGVASEVFPSQRWAFLWGAALGSYATSSLLLLARSWYVLRQRQRLEAE